jgi:hypothetical protein
MTRPVMTKPVTGSTTMSDFTILLGGLGLLVIGGAIGAAVVWGWLVKSSSQDDDMFL